MTDIEAAYITVRPRFLRTPKAAIYLRLSARTLKKLCYYVTGPVYHKFGRRVIYAIDGLERWSAPGCSQIDQRSGKGVVHLANRMATM